MNNRILNAALAATVSLTVVAAAVTLPASPAFAIPVFDVGNYAQNVLQAARALQQINNQIQSLQNEATMLTNMAKNLEHIDFPELQELRQKLGEIDRLMGEARGIDFRVADLDQQFRALFPRGFDQALTASQHAGEAKARLDTAMAAYRQTMTVQSRIVENVQGDAAMLSELAAKSQGAEGALQVGQATNQLLALAAKQQFQIQTLMAAQYRAEAMEQARRVQAESDARAATTKFLGSGTAYTPK